ncbi:MAG: hypothetical protein GEU87_14785 [Alphaproteobacteria bacterium]|nr:hypothetical protein [Alphaproteobacteria bacterium]
MHRHMKTLRGCAAGLAILAALPVSSPARADTTVAQFAKMKTADQAHLLGSLLQSLADDLEKNKRKKESECLFRLYTNTESEARVIRSPGMVDFLATVDGASKKGAADKVTVEEIIARQMVQHCGTGQPGKK